MSMRVSNTAEVSFVLRGFRPPSPKESPRVDLIWEVLQEVLRKKWCLSLRLASGFFKNARLLVLRVRKSGRMEAWITAAGIEGETLAQSSAL
jgi:hypothetical protein